ncbi:hypothetical protein Nepgr_027849 [Nepenthes gracilis]|uniref:Leucine-rich repeat-containing N-terminal plant-type domain-containing protein n=1 Tax=Nepenthes gracilis TaxID=150966 RepID=A0AAD3TB94_NEPGR|nr:hypothetical protein Nepgr_027849 [Nepenthes gracilis]
MTSSDNKQAFPTMLFCYILVLFNFCIISSAILDPLDFLALQSIRKSLADVPGSNFFDSWDFTSDPCNFAGVYCNSDKVIALNLGNFRAGAPGLSGRIDPAIGKLSALAEFTIVPGRIMGHIPETVSQLSNLRFFTVSRNFLSGSIPASFAQLRRLQTLDLSYNQLTGSIPRSLGSLPALSNLILSHNHLTGSLPHFLSQSLTRVDLMHNDLSGSLPPNFLPASILYLSLSQNKFTGPVNRVLTRLNRMNYLDLSMNMFTGIIPREIFSFPIIHLQLDRNLFYGTVQPLDQVTTQTVDLSYNRLWGGVSPMLSSVQNLYLNNNRFTGQVPACFVDRLLDATIQTLYLQHNFLTGIEINPTAEIPLTSSLCLQYNCMVPPVLTSCPLKAGTQNTRPTTQCVEWKGNLFYGTVQPLNQVTTQTVDLSYNRLWGGVSPMLSSVQNLYLNNNRFTGQVPACFVDRLLDATIQTLYLQHNFLTGIEINPTAEIPLTSSLCLQYNCMVPPVLTSCPLKAGTQKTRPTTQCVEWKG